MAKPEGVETHRTDTLDFGPADLVRGGCPKVDYDDLEAGDLVRMPRPMGGTVEVLRREVDENGTPHVIFRQPEIDGSSYVRPDDKFAWLGRRVQEEQS